MEHKRNIDDAGLGDHQDGHDPKRVCLPPLDAAGQDYSSQYLNQMVDDAYQSPEYALMQPKNEFDPPNIDDFTLLEEMNFDQLLECDVSFEQIFASTIVNPQQQLTDCPVNIELIAQSPPIDPSPPSITEEIQVCEEGRGSGLKEADTCFGAITTNVVSSFVDDQKRQMVPVDIELHGHLLKIYTREVRKYAGLLMQRPLLALLRDSKVKLEGTLILPPPAQSKRPKGPPQAKQISSSPPIIKEPQIRIIVYGMLKNATGIGKVLSDANLYLQHPSPTDCGLRLGYHNPQFLVRPGHKMPTLEDLSITASFSNGIDDQQQLDEVAKSRVLRVFDDAHDGASGDQPAVEPSPRLRTALKEHQRSALSFMSEKESRISDKSSSRSLWRISNDYDGKPTYRHIITGATDPKPKIALGGILADYMGLGKTLSLLSLICWSCDTTQHSDTSKPNAWAQMTLIVTPKSTIPGWEDQIRQHIRPGQIKVSTFHGNNRRLPAGCDVVLTTYETLRSDWGKKKLLYSKTWLRIVLDEAHHIGNRSSQLFQATCDLKASRRWCLTGTPIENSLDNYGALLSFLQIQPFTKKSQFDKWIAKPIHDKEVMSLPTLRDLVYATCLRRTEKTASQSVTLPSLTETIHEVQMHEADRELYTFFEKYTVAVASKAHSFQDNKTSRDLGRNILPLMNFLRRICDHGLQMLPPAAIDVWNRRKERTADWDTIQRCHSKCDSCQSNLREDDGEEAAVLSDLRCGHLIGSCCSPHSYNGVVDGDERVSCPVCTTRSNMKLWSVGGEQSPSPIPTDCQPSSKLETLLSNIRKEQQLNHASESKNPVKSVIFSSWTKMLDLVQTALEKEGYQCRRIDGTRSLQERKEAIESLNEDERVTIMLASISGAGEGVNLTGASSIHLLEPHWNPMAEAQAIHRVHRIGQVRPVKATRYIMANSIETYVQWVQKQKLQLVAQSLDSEPKSLRTIEEDRWTALRTCLGLDT